METHGERRTVGLVNGRKAHANRLRKSEILRGRGRFNTVYTLGKRIKGRHLDCSYLLTQQSSTVYHPLIVGFAVRGARNSAVRRNRLRRRMREAYRTVKNRSIIPSSPFYAEIVFRIGTNDDAVTVENLIDDMKKILDVILVEWKGRYA
jgi:ribonuclease P protein component